MRITRRAALQSGACLAALPTGASHPFRDPASVRAIGAWCLAAGVPPGPVPRSRAALRAAVAADFDRGAVVMVDGWMLSRTEAAACVALHDAGI